MSRYLSPCSANFASDILPAMLTDMVSLPCLADRPPVGAWTSTIRLTVLPRMSMIVTAILGAASRRYASAMELPTDRDWFIGRSAASDLCTADPSAGDDDLTISDQQVALTIVRQGRVRIANTSRRRSCFVHRDEDGEPEDQARNLAPGTSIELDVSVPWHLFLGGHAGSTAPFTILRLALAAQAVDRTRPALHACSRPLVPSSTTDREVLAELLRAPETWRGSDPTLAQAGDDLIAASRERLPPATLLSGLRRAFSAQTAVLARGTELLAHDGPVPGEGRARRAWLRVLTDHYAGFASSDRAWLHLCRAKAPSSQTRALADAGEALVGRLSANGTTVFLLGDGLADCGRLLPFWRIIWWWQAQRILPANCGHPDDLESQWLLDACTAAGNQLCARQPALAQRLDAWRTTRSAVDLESFHDAVIKQIGLGTGYAIRKKTEFKADDQETERWMDNWVYYNRAWVASRLFVAG